MCESELPDELNIDHLSFRFIAYVCSEIHQRGDRIQLKLSDADELVAKLILEATKAIHYIGKKESSKMEEKLEDSFSPRFLCMKGDGSLGGSDNLSIELDPTIKRIM